MAEFLTELTLENLNDKYWKLIQSLLYKSDILQCVVEIPFNFITDLASVPRIPIAYWFWGGRVHREAVLHDYLYRIDSIPVVSFSIANKVFLEAMKARGKTFYVRYPMYTGVVIGGQSSYHKKEVFYESMQVLFGVGK